MPDVLGYVTKDLSKGGKKPIYCFLGWERLSGDEVNRYRQLFPRHVQEAFRRLKSNLHLKYR